MTAEDALAKAMDGCEDGYSRHAHREVVASVLAALRADGWDVVPMPEDSALMSPLGLPIP
jgi:hypothetical protein